MIRFSVITHQMLLYCRLFWILLKLYYCINEELFLLFFYKLTPPWLWKYSASKPCYSAVSHPHLPAHTFFFFHPRLVCFTPQGSSGAGDQSCGWREKVWPQQVEVRRATRCHQHFLWWEISNAPKFSVSAWTDSAFTNRLKVVELLLKCMAQLFSVLHLKIIYVCRPPKLIIQQGLMFWYPENVLHHLHTSFSSSLCVIPLSVIFGVSTVTVK